MKREAVDVAVVGAGAAGLAAADALVREGITVMVLEARSRVGGRIFTTTGLPPLELGAEFLPRNGPAARILADSGAAFCRTPDTHARLELGDLAPLDFGRAMSALEAALTLTPEADPSADCTLAEALARARDRRGEAEAPRADDEALIRRYVEQYHAAPADRVSARWVADVEDTEEGGGGGEQAQCLDGLDRLPRLLAAALPAGALLLSTEVRTVNVQKQNVRLAVRGPRGDAQVEARFAIVTAPVGLLAAGVPRIDGLANGVEAALGRLRQGKVVKLGLRFRRAFWREQPGRSRGQRDFPKFLHAEPPFPTWWTAADLDAPTLVAWAGAGAAERLVGMDRDALLDAATGQLASLFSIPRPEVRSLVDEVAFHDWAGDPWARGAYTYATPGGARVPEQVAQLTRGAIILAGEALSGQMGTVDGAMSSGLRAAGRVLKKIG